MLSAFCQTTHIFNLNISSGPNDLGEFRNSIDRNFRNVLTVPATRSITQVLRQIQLK